MSSQSTWGDRGRLTTLVRSFSFFLFLFLFPTCFLSVSLFSHSLSVESYTDWTPLHFCTPPSIWSRWQRTEEFRALGRHHSPNDGINHAQLVLWRPVARACVGTPPRRFYCGLYFLHGMCQTKLHSLWSSRQVLAPLRRAGVQGESPAGGNRSG